jgi:hypothetical protein
MLFAYPGVDREAEGISADADHTRTVLAIIYSDNLELSEQNVRSAGARTQALGRCVLVISEE